MKLYDFGSHPNVLFAESYFSDKDFIKGLRSNTLIS